MFDNSCGADSVSTYRNKVINQYYNYCVHPLVDTSCTPSYVSIYEDCNNAQKDKTCMTDKFNRGYCANCPTGFRNCNSYISDSCEVNVLTSFSNCGVCGNSCNTGQTCYNGACCISATCLSLGKTCGSWSDNCGGTLNCGTCSSGSTCVSGTCQTTTPVCSTYSNWYSIIKPHILCSSPFNLCVRDSNSNSKYDQYCLSNNIYNITIN